MKKVIVLFFLLQTSYIFSQDIRSATLNVLNLTTLKFEAKLNLYVDSVVHINRPYLLLDWGPNTDSLFLTTQTQMPDGVINNEYTGTFIYPSPNTYIIQFQDNFRTADISNILNSQTQPIKIERNLVINPFLGSNNSAVINPSFTYSGNHYYISSNASDPDNDSLYFTLVPCYASAYSFPDSITINNNNGFVQFHSDSVASVSFCYKIEEWRKLGNSYYFSSYSTYDINTVGGSLSSVSQIVNQNLHLSIYPNPATSQITIETNLTETKNTFFEIKNVLGQIVLTRKLQSSEEKSTIDINNLPPGIYFVELNTAKERISKKFIKQ